MSLLLGFDLTYFGSSFTTCTLVLVFPTKTSPEFILLAICAGVQKRHVLIYYANKEEYTFSLESGAWCGSCAGICFSCDDENIMSDWSKWSILIYNMIKIRWFLGSQKFITKLKNAKDSLFTFLMHPGVLPTNNAA